jgi:MYXO-CTERM domain-containing protein
MRGVIKRLTFAGLSSLGLLLGCAAGPPEKEAGVAAEELTTKKEMYYVVLPGVPAADWVKPGVSPASVANETRAHVARLQNEHQAIRPAIESHGGIVVAEFTRLGNGFQIFATESEANRIAQLPGILRIERVPRYAPSLASALPVVGATAAWANSTPFQGDGITIGIADSGIDYTHADFAGLGTTAAYQANDSTLIEAGTFPTAKVVGGWDFVGDEYDASDGDFPNPDPDPLDCTKPQSFQVSGGHGTHVAGIAAGTGVTKANATFTGSYAQTFDPNVFRVAPGVAPKAKLYALKIFGCNGSTEMLGAAVERASDPNEDGAFDDRLDVVNASLGTAYSLSGPFSNTLLENLAKVGSLFVAAAGNDGQSFYAAASPGTAPSVLSVAGSADNQFLALEVTSPPTAAKTMPAAEGGFTTRLSDVGKLTSELVQVSPQNGCQPFSNAAAVNGKIALIDRGGCPFVTKFENAVDAGAIAGVVVDNEVNDLPLAMSGGDTGTVPIPGVLILQLDGNALKQSVAQGPVTIVLDPSVKYTGLGSELLASFSARGPSPVDNRLKPEIAAPGFAIDSARVGSGFSARRSDGTSMASPFVAGAAALVRQAQPEYSPLQVKAALVNSAVPLLDLEGQPYGSSIVGSGRLAVDRAVGMLVIAAADPLAGDVGVSFGSLIAAEPADVKRTFVVENHGATSVTLAVNVEPNHTLQGVSVTATETSIEVAPDASATVELTLALDPEALGHPGPDPGTAVLQFDQPRQYLNEAAGLVRLVPAGGGEDVVIPYLGSVRAAGHRKADTSALCGGAAEGEPISIPMAGASAHPEPVVTAFQLGTLDPALDTSDPAKQVSDIRAVGAASNLITEGSFEEASVYFGVAVSGQWTTPARGQLSVVSIEIDADRDGSYDYAIRTEPLTATGPYADLIACRVYLLATNEPVGDPHFINIVDAASAATEPFGNSVLVLSARLDEVGLSPDNPIFDYSAVTEDPVALTIGERTIKSTFDPAKPVVDTAKHGEEGRPLFNGDAPVLVEVAPDARASGAPQDLLLLHHTNVAGERFEVVNLASQAGNISLAGTGPASVNAGDTATVQLEVKSASESTTSDTTLHADVQGGTVVSATAAQGTCTTSSASVDCELGNIEPNASVGVSVTVRATAGSGNVVVSSEIEPGLTCEALLTDNQADVTLEIGGGPNTGDPDTDGIEPGGGCGCRATGAGSNHAWLAALGAALVFSLRRRFDSPRSPRKS